MRHALRRALRALLAACLIAGVDACFEMDFTGPDPDSGTGCYLCYPEVIVPTIPFEATPVAVAGGLRFTALSVGTGHVCGVSDSEVFCWGEQNTGTPAYGNITAPVPTAGTTGSIRVDAGHSFTCAVAADSRATCWGVNGAGELGNGQNAPSWTPGPVQGGLAFTSISASGVGSERTPHACGLTQGGAAYCWGSNQWGALGDGSLTSSRVPVAVAGGHVFESISVGAEFTCGIVRAAGAYCWGFAGDGRLGDDPADSPNCLVNGGGGGIPCRTIPAPVPGGRGFTMIAAGGAHACAVDTDGTSWCWGANLFGQLGVGDYRWRFSPSRVSGTLRFATIAAGTTSTCGLTTIGDAFCWGSNQLGELGDGTTVTHPSPVEVATDRAFSAIDVGHSEACALTLDGFAYCWGSNAQGKLGKGG
jgi:alpha-tubulin suppressor-like RCC1 family protein